MPEQTETPDDDLSDVPLRPILDLWEALIKAEPDTKMPPLGPGHVRAMGIALRDYARPMRLHAQER